MLAFIVPACPGLPPPDGCPPRATRCHDGVPQVCSPTQRWTPADQVCTAIGAVCCRTTSPYDRELHACVPGDRCIAERVLQDGGVE